MSASCIFRDVRKILRGIGNSGNTIGTHVYVDFFPRAFQLQKQFFGFGKFDSFLHAKIFASVKSVSVSVRSRKIFIAKYESVARKVDSYDFVFFHSAHNAPIIVYLKRIHRSSFIKEFLSRTIISIPIK